jgi:hypothetical protein
MSSSAPPPPASSSASSSTAKALSSYVFAGYNRGFGCCFCGLSICSDFLEEDPMFS